MDLTYDEFIETMSKCGIIMRDLQTEDFKVKLYKDKDGNLKGDGLCCYLKVSFVLGNYKRFGGRCRGYVKI